MTKTTLQLLIEERAGKDIRDVMTEAYEASGGSIERAAAWIRATYGTPGPSFAIYHDWIDAGKGRIAKALTWDDQAVEAAA